MRICLVSETWTPDINGVAHTLAQLSGQLRERGFSLQLVRPRPANGEHRAEGMDSELQVRGASVPGYREVRLGFPSGGRIRRLWQAERPDVVYVATEGPLGWSALTAAEKLGIPVVSGWHTNFDHYCRDYGVDWLRPLVTQRLRRFHNRCGATLVPTHAQARDLGQRGFERVKVMARGIDGERFSPAHRDPALREQWGADEHRPVALYVGRLAPEKNLDLLRDTFAAMLDAHPGLTLVVVGDGPGRANLERALPQAHFAGFVSPDDLIRYYASADLFVFPSISETWGNVLLEAMASGLATVAFRHAAGAELIEDDVNGVHLAVGDEAGFRDAAVALCQQPARYGRLGRAARQRALGYRWPAITDDFLAALTHAREMSDETSRPCRV
ncbi:MULTISPECIES: glycosyltransferase family 4 protein [Halomonas]|uniref:Glycoside hydrolase n=1 Tax=Halomonas halophila TaxID=29573 RepID=A0ABQ0U0A2_9GAMM|nr:MULTISPECIES: glycosyltransferase family 1 protein [Halomonas]MDR5888331.1 glycosyltransferase family 1 protein [Halomonas salina]RAH36698.1 glycosyltransferase family 1 protein [Halomonas sp. SL1]WJY08841.1 glycosyltransferase family 1 protein [Halomonas halophila]GEK71802.1 glycoside hydrolase [Halomonas halophila]